MARGEVDSQLQSLRLTEGSAEKDLLYLVLCARSSLRWQGNQL